MSGPAELDEQELARLTARVLEALGSADPAAALERGREAAGLGPGARAALAQADPDGLRLAGLLVKKLRLERLLAGDPALRQAFRADPPGFTARVRRYDAAVPPTTTWPAEEAAAFRAFEAGR